MKRIILSVLLIFFAVSASAEEASYEQIYRDLEPANFSYVHNIDPGEMYDVDKNAWSPYPLFRLTSNLYFKNTVIEPGYYLLTPREHKGNWYILFKEAGQIRYIVPVYKKEIVPVNFYNDNLPKVKLRPTQRIHIGLLDFVGNHVKSSQRKPAKKTYLEATDLENNFLSLVVYWGNYRYYMIFRTIRL